MADCVIFTFYPIMCACARFGPGRQGLIPSFAMPVSNNVYRVVTAWPCHGVGWLEVFVGMSRKGYGQYEARAGGGIGVFILKGRETSLGINSNFIWWLR